MSTDALVVNDSIATSAESHGLTGAVKEFEVVNVDGAGYVTYTIDGTTAVLDAEGALNLPKSAGAKNVHKGSWSGGITLSLIASTATVVSIRKLA